MDKLELFGILFLFGIFLCVNARCPPVYEVMGEIIEKCAGSLDRHNGKTLKGTLNRKSRNKACLDYEDSMECIDEIIASCSGRHDDLESKMVASQFRMDQENGFGQMCQGDSYFEEYLVYASCFKDNQKATGKCVENFTMAVEEGDQVCSSINNLRNCIEAAVTPFCDEVAAQFYFELCKHQVPSMAFVHCMSTTEPIPTSPLVAKATMHVLDMDLLLVTLIVVSTTVVDL